MRQTIFACAIAFTCVSNALGQSTWSGYGGNPQHSAVYTGSSQSIKNIHWQTSLDDNRSYYGGEVLIHYSSPLISQYNTLVHGFRSTSQVNGTAYYDHWSVTGRSGSTGTALWQFSTDYSAPNVYPNGWTSVFPMTLAPVRSAYQVNFFFGFGFSFYSYNTGVVAAGSGGSLLVRPNSDTANEAIKRLAFYTSARDFNANSAAYAPVKINTPLTSDSAGNVYFGYEVTGAVPPNLASLGTGGIAKVNVSTGNGFYKSVQSLNIDSSLARPAMNAAPALSPDGQYAYFALTNSGGSNGFLAKIDVATGKPVASIQLMDPSVPGGGAQLIDQSSGSPMVGPDGHVFMGVFGYYWRESHGWMLQFDSNLKQTNSAGKRLAVGAFGWDDTASVVPRALVASYKGASPYLILTKYNNYIMDFDAGADGLNKVAILDPGSDSVSKDRQSGISVMNEVLTVLSPTLAPDSVHPQARNEWCINSAAVDQARKSAIINCEDGRVYRWDFSTNTLSESLTLQPATGEAYTSTCIGADGTVYAINNSILFAIGN